MRPYEPYMAKELAGLTDYTPQNTAITRAPVVPINPLTTNNVTLILKSIHGDALIYEEDTGAKMSSCVCD